MKKLLLFTPFLATAILLSSTAHADYEDWDDEGYYPQQQINNYYPPQPQYYGYDQRSHQGLAGGVIGSVFGYELGAGDPIAAGLGAAAGSFFGNGFGMGYQRWTGTGLRALPL